MDIIVVNRYGVLGFRIVYAVHKDNPHLAQMRKTLENRVEIKGMTSVKGVRSYLRPASFSNWVHALGGLGEVEDIILLCPLYPLYGNINTAFIFSQFLMRNDTVTFWSNNTPANTICASCPHILECLKTNTSPLTAACQFFKDAPSNGLALGNMLKIINPEGYQKFLEDSSEDNYEKMANILGLEPSVVEELLRLDEEFNRKQQVVIA